MRTLRFTFFRYALVFFLAFGWLIVDAPSASANTRYPEGQVPFYARIDRTLIYHTDDWVAIVFYRPPGCIPDLFNLLDFFDIPAAFDCNPPTTTGFSIWENGPPPIDFAPKLAELHGLGAVPVWFVSWPALQTAIADNVLTIGELVSLNPLVGSASSYHETLRPSPIGELLSIEFNAKGTLEDGRSFQLTATGKDVSTKTRIVFR